VFGLVVSLQDFGWETAILSGCIATSSRVYLLENHSKGISESNFYLKKEHIVEPGT